MWFKCMVILLLVAFESRLISGQYFFRNGYVYVDDVNNFYKINTKAKTWSQAKIQCVLEGATLFYPEDDEEALVMIDLWNTTKPQMKEMYIGVGGWNVRDIFETVDGRRMSDVYDNWAFGEPNNDGGNEGCVVMQRDGTLKDENCEKKYPFVCKKTLGTLQWNYACNIPDPYYKYSEEMRTCYKFHLSPKNWSDAYVTCNAEQSYLAIINSPEEDQILINITAEAPKDNIGGDYLRGAVHLGFHNMNGIWETVKGVPLEKSGFGHGWGYTQPDGGGKEKCGSMFYTGELNDIGCWQKMFFICEHEINIRAEDIKYKFGSELSNDVINVIPTNE